MEPRAAVLKTIYELLDDWKGPAHDPVPPPDWENWTIPQFLEAMAAWLDVYEQAWRNRGEQPPTDGWVVFEAALRMGAYYE